MGAKRARHMHNKEHNKADALRDAAEEREAALPEMSPLFFGLTRRPGDLSGLVVYPMCITVRFSF